MRLDGLDRKLESVGPKLTNLSSGAAPGLALGWLKDRLRGVSQEIRERAGNALAPSS